MRDFASILARLFSLFLMHASGGRPLPPFMLCTLSLRANILQDKNARSSLQFGQGARFLQSKWSKRGTAEFIGVA